MGADWFLLWALRESLLLACLLASGGVAGKFGIPWLVDMSLEFCLYVHMPFSLCVSMPTFLF